TPCMPLAPCLEPRCPTLVNGGRCPEHQRAKEAIRGSASDRGYSHAWRMFRPAYIRMLIDANVPAICGAALPNGPRTQDSLCKAEGKVVSVGLHLDHEPPLTDLERLDTRIVCEPTRIQLLCGP